MVIVGGWGVGVVLVQHKTLYVPPRREPLSGLVAYVAGVLRHWFLTPFLRLLGVLSEYKRVVGGVKYMYSRG